MFYDTADGLAFTQYILRQQNPRSNWVEGGITAGSYFILLNTMIPISLLVSIQVIKFAQGLFIGFDIFMKKNGHQGKAFRSTINEELGMIQYVFTDKTGTLTRNQMVLMKIAVGGEVYTN